MAVTQRDILRAGTEALLARLNVEREQLLQFIENLDKQSRRVKQSADPAPKLLHWTQRPEYRKKLIALHQKARATRRVKTRKT